MRATVKKGFEIQVKRFYMNDAIFTLKCPNCGANVKYDLGQQYLSCPIVGGDKMTVYCDGYNGCDHYWDVEYDLQISIEIEEV